MKKHILITSRLTLAALLAGSLCLLPSVNAAEESKTTTESKLSMNDKKFLKKAYKGGMEEVENAKIAKDKAKNDATKEVADRMISDHSNANEDLKKIAEEENLDLSKVKAKPGQFSDTTFDKEYLTMLKKDHEKDIAEFEKEANDAGANEDSDVVAFAKKTLPTLKDHLKMVEDALAKVQ
jgi:putative membrane protein